MIQDKMFSTWNRVEIPIQRLGLINTIVRRILGKSSIEIIELVKVSARDFGFLTPPIRSQIFDSACLEGLRPVPYSVKELFSGKLSVEELAEKAIWIFSDNDSFQTVYPHWFIHADTWEAAIFKKDHSWSLDQEFIFARSFT
jgi:hypothetical protein